MPTFEEVREENRRLKAEQNVREDFDRRNAEKKALQKENFALKHPGLTNVAGRVGQGFKAMGGAIVEAGKSAGKNAGRKGPAFGMNFGRGGMRMPRMPRF